MHQRKIWQDRLDRKNRIEKYKHEHISNVSLQENTTNLMKMINDGDSGKLRNLLKQIYDFEKKTKPEILEKHSKEGEGPVLFTHEQAFYMLVTRLGQENGIPMEVDCYMNKLFPVIEQELKVLKARQLELESLIRKEEKEQNKKLTSENICHQGFNKTVINPSAIEKKKTATTKTIEVLNPNYAENKKSSAQTTTTPGSQKEATPPNLTNSELNILEEFSKCKSYIDQYQIIQKYPDLVSRSFVDQSLLYAFQNEYEENSVKAKRYSKAACALRFCLEIGSDGPKFFYSKLINDQQDAVKAFEMDADADYQRIKERCKILRQNKQIETSGSSYSPKQNAQQQYVGMTKEQNEAFITFPKHFQEALASGKMENVQGAFKEMDRNEATRVFELCTKTGILAFEKNEQSGNMKDGDKTVEETPKSMSQEIVEKASETSKKCSTDEANKEESGEEEENADSVKEENNEKSVNASSCCVQ